MKQAYTPQQIALQRRKLKAELEQKKHDIETHFGALFAPPPPSRNSVERFVNNAKRYGAVIDGLLFGYKLFRTTRRYFPRSRRR